MADTAAQTELAPSLIQAYLTTHYRLQALDWFLRVGHPQPALAPFYQRHAVQCATYLTACNPFSEPLPAAANQQRMVQLRLALQRAGWAWTDGYGQDPLHTWPAEDSVLIWGMDRSTAQAWGQQWAQNAIIHCDAHYCPELVLLR